MHEDEISVGRAKDLRGQKFGMLTVLYRVQNQGKKVKWKCQCECGNITVAEAGNLTSGNTKGCGCKKGVHIKDISGQRFGRLIAIKPTIQVNSKWKWLCKCDCGKEIETFSDYLIQGVRMSCGCFQEENRHNNSANLINQKFGKLLVLEEAYRKNYQVY